MQLPLRELIELKKTPGGVTRREDGAVVLHEAKLLGERSSNVNPDGTRNVYPARTRATAVAPASCWAGRTLGPDQPVQIEAGDVVPEQADLGCAR